MHDATQSKTKDAELVAQAKAGDVEAFGELYERYLDPIYRYIRTRVAEDQTAEDLTEMVFLRTFERLDRYQERGHPFSSFLYRVARNQLVDHYRIKKDEISLEAAQLVEHPASSMDEHIIKQDQANELRSAIEKLPEDYQDVIRFRILMDMPTAEVASWLVRSEGATRVLLHRALHALREHAKVHNE